MTWPYIEQIIRLSDYYVLILHQAYGSLYPGEDISWTEKEFECAKACNKPIMVFPSRFGDPVTDPASIRFRARIAGERMVSFWRDQSELVTSVTGSLLEAVRTHPAPGWVRTDAFLDEEESMLTFSRRSADFDFTPFIASHGEIRIMVNDGFSWLRKYGVAMEERFRQQPGSPTIILHVSETSPMLGRVARKSGKSLAQQRGDIAELRAALFDMAVRTGYGRLQVLGHDRMNTHCLYLNRDYVIVTTYFTSDNRFLHLPLYKFRAATSVYDDFYQDFDILYREALAKPVAVRRT